MGRELKRVSLDFSWPLNKTWKGYMNPYNIFRRPCVPCFATGFSPVAKLWRDKWYGDALFAPDETGSTPFDPFDLQIQELVRPKIESGDTQFWLDAFGVKTLKEALLRESVRMCRIWNRSWRYHLDQDDVYVLFEKERLYNFGNPTLCPLASEVNWMGLVGMGHNSVNCDICLKARMSRMGHPLLCMVCGGEGDTWPSKEAKDLHENWSEAEPPEGAGWQVWETIPEGSPVSPVFTTEEALQNWLIHEQGYSEGAAERFTQVGWSPTMVMSNGHAYKDIESLNMGRE